MKNHFCEWVLIFTIGFVVLGNGFEFDETQFHFNTTEAISFMEASSATVPNPLLVGLTLIPQAAAKGAGM